MKESLLSKEQAELEAAPFLFAEEDLPKIDRARPKFHCTGERLFRDRPDVYKTVVRLLADPGVTIRTICQECHVTDDVVRSVKVRENVSIAHEKKNVLANITHGLRLASERVIEMLPSASAKDALLGVGILTDKLQLLSGDVTARVEVDEKKIDIYQHWKDFLAGKAPGLATGKYLPVIEGELLNSEKVLETRVSGEKHFLTEDGEKASGDAMPSNSRPEIDAGGSHCPQKALTDNTAALSRDQTETGLNGAVAPRNAAV